MQTLSFISHHATNKPESFCMVTVRKQDGTIGTLEHWSTRTVGSKRKKFRVLRLAPEQINYWLMHWKCISSDYKIPLLYLQYVLKNPKEFETGVVTVVPQDVQDWVLNEHTRKNSQLSIRNPTAQLSLGL